MFKELGAMMNLLNNKSKLQEEMGKFQQTVAQLSAEGTAGGGMVVAKVNGRMELLSCKIADDAWKMNDREMIEDLMIAATNQAMNKVRELLAAETNKMAQNMGIPPGMMSGLGGLPGLG